MTPDRKVIRLRPHEEFTGGPAWTDAELMELLNAEQIVTLWTTHLFSRQKGSPEWRPVERESEVREAIDNWHEGFDLFAAAQDDADTLREWVDRPRPPRVFAHPGGVSLSIAPRTRA